MKNLFILVAICHLFHFEVCAQIELVSSCEEITEVHELSTLNGYVGQMESGNGVPLDIAFCFNSGDIDNPNWLAFTVEPYFEYSLDLLFYNCMPGAQTSSVGGQIAVYDTCDLTAAPLFCYAQQGNEDSPISISDYMDFELGKTYYMLLDGYAGSVCDIYIEVEKYLPMESITDWQYGAVGSLGEPSYFWYKDIGDTLINGLEYREIEVSSEPFASRFIREDIPNKKVYSFNSINNQENLLYDFSAQLGDELYYDSNSGYYEVVNIDTVESYYGELKRWELRRPGWNTIFIIEGIGSEELFLSNMFFDPVYNSLCAYHENDKIYGNDNCVAPPRWINNYTLLTVDICEGDTYVFGGKEYMDSGEYVDSLINEAGGDSIVTLELNVLLPTYVSLNQTLCEGDVYEINGIVFDIFSPSGNITIAGGAFNGCDSIINVELSFVSAIVENYQTTICEGSSEIWANETIFLAGEYSFNLLSVNGCDSIVNLSVEVVNHIYTEIQEEICEGDQYVFYGMIYTESGSYGAEYEASNGCDSVVVLKLNVKPLIAVLDTFYFCPPEVVTINGVSIAVAGQFQFQINSQLGCDTLFTAEVIELTEAECTTGTSDLQPLGIDISPNPFDQSMNILSDEVIQSIEIINISGVKVYAISEVDAKEYIYDGSSLAAGVYILSVRSKDMIAIQRIVKR